MFIFVHIHDTTIDLKKFLLIDKNLLNFEVNRLHSFPIAPLSWTQVCELAMLNIEYFSVAFAFVFSYICYKALFDGSRLVSQSAWIKRSLRQKNAICVFIQKLFSLMFGLASSFASLDDGKRFLYGTSDNIGNYNKLRLTALQWSLVVCYGRELRNHLFCKRHCMLLVKNFSTRAACRKVCYCRIIPQAYCIKEFLLV